MRTLFTEQKRTHFSQNSQKSRQSKARFALHWTGLLLVLALAGGSARAQWYVDATATGANNGSSWADAFVDFQSAITAAASGETIYVAAGTYKPSLGPGRTKKFTLVEGVKMYGGFPNGGGTFAQRDFSLNRTILSGDLGTQGDSTDNAFVVVDANNLTPATLMSGFTIEEGNADSTGFGHPFVRAGGIHLGATGSMRMDSLTVRNNYGKNGSGVYAEGPTNWVVRGCVFDNNTDAAAIYIGGNATGSFSGCVFSNNKGFVGGAISLNVLTATMSFTNCSFTNNVATATGGGGAINGGNSASTFTNCTFTNNRALTGPGGALYKFYSTLNTFTNCTFVGNRAAGGGGALYGQGGFNLFRCEFRQNLVTNNSNHGGALYNNGTPSTIENCVFWDNRTTLGIGGAIYNNTGGTLNIRNCTFANNNALGFSQGGGLNNNSSSNATVNNCIFWGNLANNNDTPANSEIGHGSGTLNVTNTIWQGQTPSGTIYNVNPLFSNQGTGDLTLTLCSPAIDTGSSAGMPVVDFPGNSRPFNARPGTLDYDLGAYEFQSSAVDVTPPNAICRDVTVSLNAGGNGSTTATAVNNGSTDNCGITSMVLSTTAFTCVNVGPNVVTLTLHDAAGNISTCDATVTVQDLVAPTANCQNLTLFLNGAGTVGVIPAMLNNGSSDACGIASTSIGTSSYNCSVATSNHKLMWSDATTLVKAESNGTGAQTLTSNPARPLAFQYVPSKDSIYFTDNNNGKLSRVHVNGGAVTDIKTGIIPFGIAVDPVGGRIYWSDPSGNTINRCSMGGNGNQVIVSGPADADYSRILKLDLVNSKIYWTDANLGTIKRANLDGTGLQTLISGQGNIVGLALDVPNNKMYWTSYSFTQLKRANLDGTGQTTLTGTASLPLGVTIDPYNSKIYVACGFGSNVIQRFNLDGTGGTTVASGLNTPYEIQFLPQIPNVLTVTDVNGNTSSCTSYVTVRDSIRPTAVCQNLTLNLNTGGNASTTAAAINNGSSDNCGVSTLAASQTAFTCAHLGSNAITLTVTDPSGNTGTCAATVTVQDLINPTISCPSNINVNNTSGQCGATVSYSTPVGVDNCTGSTTTRTTGQESGTLFPIGTTTNTFQVTDGAGNTATCAFTVTVNETQAPVISCPSSMTLGSQTGICGAPHSYTTPVGTDNCPGAVTVQIAGLASGATFPVGSTLNTFRVTDAVGLTSQCSFTVTVIDVQNPAITCPSNISQSNNTGTCGAVVNYTSPTGTDNCPGATTTRTAGLASGANFPIGTTTNTFRVTDGTGNTASCSFTVTITDSELPTITCPANITGNNDPGQCSKVATFTAPVGTDNCPGPVTTQTSGLASGAAFPVGITTNAFRVTDASGNSATCAFTVTITDIEMPTITCPANVSGSNDPGLCSKVVTFTSPAGADNCAGATTTQTAGLASGAAFPVGLTTNTFRVTDASGNSATCSFTIAITDNELPTITCPANMNVNAQTGTCGATVTYTVPVGSDNCPGATTTRTAGLASGATFNLGVTTNTFRVTDASGNSATCSFTVTVVDNQIPTITCPSNIAQNNVTNSCGAVVNFTAPSGTDNCPSATTTQTAGLASGSNFPIGVTTNTFLSTDASGNTATCSFTVTITDNQLPSITCPANVVLNSQSGICSTTATYSAPVGTDNCPGATTTQTAGLASGAAFNVGVTTNTFRVTDASGNSSTCSFTVTVVDNEAPAITCPASITASAGVGACDAVATFTTPIGTDNCSGAATLQTAGLPTGATFPVGVITNTFRVTDASGNTTTCSFTVTITDNELPALTCPSNITANTQTGVCGATVTYSNPVGTDNCSGVSTVLTAGLPSGTQFPVGVTTNAFLSTDASGNTATCSFTVTVNDVTPPTAICQNVTIQLDSLGGANGTAALVNNGSNDACGVTNLVLSINAFSCANVGSNAVVLTATDANGNTGTCSATVTVQDLIAPIAVCTNATVDLNASGNAVMGASVIGAGSSDNCGFTAALSQGSFTCADIGVRTVTLTLTDPSGNTGTCSASVTVRDVTPPSAVCTNATVTLNGSGQGVLGASVIGLGTSDACGAFTATISQDSFSCAHVGSNAVVLTATDASGNSSSCTAVVLVVDNTAPQAICQSATVVLDANGQGSLTPNAVNNGSSDACGILSMGLDITAFDCSDVGSSAVVLTVADMGGNTASCSASVTVVDTIAPIAICQNATVTLNSSGNGSLTVNQVNNGSSDVCGLSNIGLDAIAFGCAQVGMQSVTLTASDAGGNTATCTAFVTVEDITPPLALCHDATVQLDSNGTYSLSPAELNSNSNDACGIDTMALSLSNLTCSHIGNQSVTMTLTDGSGNSSSCTVMVTVEDLIAPVADCNPATIALDSLGSITLNASDISNSTDNCAILSNVLSLSAFTCSDLGSQAVTLTMSDGSGNTSSCAVTVTVADSTAPVAVCQDLTLQLDSLGNATLLPADLDNGSSDACGIDTMSLSRSAFTCANLGPQAVTLIVSDASGNSSTCASTVTVIPATLVVTPVAVVQSCGYHVTCTGANDGSAFVNVTGGCSPYSYAWSNGATTDTLSGLVAGAYSVTVSDASGQSSIQSLVLVQPDAVSVTFGGDSAVCLGSLAHLVAQPFGGNACQGFNYLWSTSDTTDSISGLSAGLYAVTVTDAFGCSGIDSVHVNTSLVASLNLGADTLGCPGGDVQFSAPGGFNAYAWSNGAQSQTAALAVPGTYSCTITDLEGCIASDTVQVGALTVDDDIITVNGHLPICIGDTVQLIGDAGLTGYQWSTGATSSSIYLTGQGGDIVLTAVEGQGCTIHDTVNVAFVNVLGPDPVIVPGPAVTICQGSSVTLDAGGGYVFWDWSSGDTTQTVAVNTAGTWSVTVENGFGCLGESDPVFVVVAPQPVVTLQDNAGTLVASSGFVNYDWLLNGQPILPNYHGSTLVPPQSGSYQVIGTDLNGCQDTSNAVVMTVVGTEAESSDILDVEVFPNPARDILNLRALTSIHGPVRIEIWDMFGQRLEVRELSNLTGIETFDLSRYASGSYMIRIQVLKAGKEAAFKLIKN